MSAVLRDGRHQPFGSRDAARGMLRLIFVLAVLVCCLTASLDVSMASTDEPQAEAALGEVPKDESSTTLLMRRDRQLDPASLFASSRRVRDDARFIARPLLAGETLAAMLVRNGSHADDAEAAANAIQSAELDGASAVALAPGTLIHFVLDDRFLTLYQIEEGSTNQTLLNVEVLLGGRQLVSVSRASGYQATIEPVDVERRFVAVGGEIQRSLASASRNAGLPTSLLSQFADVFAFDVDFAREIYRGDRFEVVYEMLFDQEGRPLTPGNIVFAGLTWKGRSQSKAYYRHATGPANEPGYFAANGRNPRTLLMKSPINGARVTSRFGARQHPVLGYTVGHKGVDFGAPVGTPILAAGDGEVAIASPRGTFGNYIRLDHQGGYQTAYAHLNGFAEGIVPGARVKQGQVIGYVGTTGRSTGPHLHYEVLRNGQHENPQTAKVAVGETLVGENLRRFNGDRDRIDSLRLTPFVVQSATLP